jgi:substrate-binding family protein
VNLFEKDLKNKYGAQLVSRYNYALDVSQFPSEAVRAVVQFQAAGATTVILACDNISPIFLTQGAKQQGWHPEWVLIGVAGTDSDAAAASYDQDEVNGHLFGMSQIGNYQKLISPTGEAARVWREATGEKKLPQGAETQYYNLVQIFSLLQAAGPVLTPANAAAGIRTFPPGGGSHGPAGTWSWAHDHTAVIDAREIYWNGDSGHFIETYGGKRFQSGQWPRSEPPIYPKN